MKRIGIVTEDRRLYQKIRLALFGECECVALGEDEGRFGFDIILLDRRGIAPTLYSTGDGVRDNRSDVVTVGGSVAIVDREVMTRGDIGYPFGFDELRKAVLHRGAGITARLLVEDGSNTVFFDKKEIHLTDVEHRLLLEIYRGGGEYVSRERLQEAVWGDGATNGVLSVYIHYLREKLEACGEKVIASSRGGGYKIEKKYLGGEG